MSEGEKWWKKLDPLRGFRKAKEEKEQEETYTHFINRVDTLIHEALKTDNPLEDAVRRLAFGSAGKQFGVLTPNTMRVYIRYLGVAIGTEAQVPMDPTGKRLRFMRELVEELEKRLNLKET